MRVASQGRSARIFNLACGPALEVQKFLIEQEISNQAEVELIDFNEETLEHANRVLSELKAKHHRTSNLHFVKKSVNQILKGGGKTIELPAASKHDFVYCAGLFDYLSDSICTRLMRILYDRLSPGGLLLVTNVDRSRPFHTSMEYILDWRLVCRTGPKFQEMVSRNLPPSDISVKSDPTGVNIFLEVRKPKDA